MAKTRVVPASDEALERFTKAELIAYAVDIGVADDRKVCRPLPKQEIIDALVRSGKATLCASLGT